MTGPLVLEGGPFWAGKIGFVEPLGAINDQCDRGHACLEVC